MQDWIEFLDTLTAVGTVALVLGLAGEILDARPWGDPDRRSIDAAARTREQLGRACRKGRP